MAFGKAIAAETFDLLEAARREVGFIAAAHHAADHLLLILMDRPGISERRHRTPQAIGFIGRSEEHTSELQSLMRISYAVFCLKKKNKNSLHLDIADKHIRDQPIHTMITPTT